MSFSSIPSLLSVFFNHERVLNVVKCFFCINLDDCVSFFLQSINVIITLNDFHTKNQPCILATEPSWSRHVNLSMCCGVWFAGVLLRVCTAMFIKNIGLEFSCGVFIWLWCEGNAGLIK